MSQAAEAVLSIEIACDKCGRRRGEPPDVFLQMAPKIGTDHHFYLCAPCWLDHEGFDGPGSRIDGRVIEPVTPRVEAVIVPPLASDQGDLMTEGVQRCSKRKQGKSKGLAKPKTKPS